MTNIDVKFSNDKFPTSFEDVQEFYDGFHWLEIIQHTMYKDTKTRIRKASIDYYRVREVRDTWTPTQV